MKALKRKGQIAGLQTFLMGIVGVTIVLAIGFVVLSETRSSVANCPSGYSVFDPTANVCYKWSNSTNESAAHSGSNASASVTTMIGKLTTIPNWIGIIIVIALAMLVLGYFYMRNR